MKNLFYAFLIGLFVCGCSGDEEEQLTVGSLVGSVSDQSTGEPVPVVNVSLSPGGHTTVTGSDGSFSYPELEPGTYTVHISKEGYKNAEGEFTVKAGQSSPAHLLIERIPATITPDREVLDFGENAGLNMLSFAIVNTNYAALDWTIEYDCEWIKEVKPASGTLASGKTETIVVSINRDAMNSGNNETMLVIKTTNGRAEIKATTWGAEKSLPVLNTLDATEIGANTAVLNGEIVKSGTPTYTERGFVYAKTMLPTLETALAKISAPVTADSKYACTLDGLTVGETYYVRAYAVNSLGTAYSSNEIHFTTKASLAQITVQQPTDINVATGTAVFHGTVSDLGNPAATEIGFVYGLLSTPTVNDNKVVSGKTVVGAFNQKVDNLPLDKTVYVRAYAMSEKGIAYSKESISFSTNAIPSQVSTLDPVDVDFSNGTATLVGQIVNTGTPAYTERGFVYSTMHDPTVNDNKIVANGNGTTGRFSLYVTGLPTGKPVYIRAYATGERVGTVYGEEVVIQPEWIELKSAGIAVQTKDLGYVVWKSADSMCENSIVGGFTDWRLPTKDELMVLYNNKDLIGGFNTGRYWSSSFKSTAEKYYYYVIFETGDLDTYSIDYSYKCRVRAVRTLN